MWLFRVTKNLPQPPISSLQCTVDLGEGSFATTIATVGNSRNKVGTMVASKKYIENSCQRWLKHEKKHRKTLEKHRKMMVEPML